MAASVAARSSGSMRHAGHLPRRDPAHQPSRSACLGQNRRRHFNCSFSHRRRCHLLSAVGDVVGMALTTFESCRRVKTAWWRQENGSQQLRRRARLPRRCPQLRSAHARLRQSWPRRSVRFGGALHLRSGPAVMRPGLRQSYFCRRGSSRANQLLRSGAVAAMVADRLSRSVALPPVLLHRRPTPGRIRLFHSTGSRDHSRCKRVRFLCRRRPTIAVCRRQRRNVASRSFAAIRERFLFEQICGSSSSSGCSQTGQRRLDGVQLRSALR